MFVYFALFENAFCIVQCKPFVRFRLICACFSMIWEHTLSVSNMVCLAWVYFLWFEHTLRLFNHSLMQRYMRMVLHVLNMILSCFLHCLANMLFRCINHVHKTPFARLMFSSTKCRYHFGWTPLSAVFANIFGGHSLYAVSYFFCVQMTNDPQLNAV